MISGLQHPNLVRLYGCCIEGAQLLLVYEYMENNSLARVLFGKLNVTSFIPPCFDGSVIGLHIKQVFFSSDHFRHPQKKKNDAYFITIIGRKDLRTIF